MADGEVFLQSFRSKVVAITVEPNDWYSLATEVPDKLKTADADAAILPSLREATLGDTDAHMVELAELQENQTAKDVKLLESDTKNRRLADKWIRIRSQMQLEVPSPSI